MKRCPECRRDYYDDSLLYCLDDGSALLEGPASQSEPAASAGGQFADGPATAILHTTDAIGDAPTRAQIHTTEAAESQKNSGASSERLSLSANRATKPLVALGVAVVLLVGGFFAYRYFKPAAAQISSIAVLPFQNRSGDPNADYLSDGLAESLIYRLSQLPDLKVSPTSSVIRYKGKDTEVSKIASDLGVDAVMTGRLAQIGDNLTISVELIDVRNNKLLWGEQYERKMADLLTTQREIAAEIADKLKLKISGEGQQKLAKKYTEDSEAYQLYLKGRYYWNKRDSENFSKAIEQFKAAADKDPNFALALVGLADCYALLPEYASTPTGEAMPQAKAFALRALEIDSSLAEAHASLANIYSLSWEWDAADHEFQKAIELDPRYATGHKWYGLQLAILNRYDESLAHMRKAVELEPLSLSVNLDLADIYFGQGDYGAAAEQSRRTRDLDPNWYYPWLYVGLADFQLGKKMDAAAEIEKSVALSKRHTIPLGMLGYVYGQTGKRKEALAIVEELKQKYAERQANGYDLARVYMGLGDKDQAFAWLERDFQTRSSLLPYWTNVWPPLNSLREDPRFMDLNRRMGVPESK